MIVHTLSQLLLVSFLRQLGLVDTLSYVVYMKGFDPALLWNEAKDNCEMDFLNGLIHLMEDLLVTSRRYLKNAL